MSSGPQKLFLCAVVLQHKVRPRPQEFRRRLPLQPLAGLLQRDAVPPGNPLRLQLRVAEHCNDLITQRLKRRVEEHRAVQKYQRRPARLQRRQPAADLCFDQRQGRPGQPLLAPLGGKDPLAQLAAQQLPPRVAEAGAELLLQRPDIGAAGHRQLAGDLVPVQHRVAPGRKPGRNGAFAPTGRAGDPDHPHSFTTLKAAARISRL